MDIRDKCSQCGYEFLRNTVPVPCPKCGGTSRIISGSINETLKIRDALGFKIKGPRKTGHGKVRVEGFTRYAPSQVAPLVKHERLIDRGHDHYLERVEDADTGQVLHHRDEPLSKHVGHGTARRKGKRRAT